jgi:hypothetical protein
MRRRTLLALAFATAVASVALAPSAAAEPPQGQIDLVAGAVAATDVAALPDGSVIIADQSNNRVRKVSPSGATTTVAGIGTPGAGGDAGPATAAQLNGPTGVASTGDGGFLIADTNNRRVRRVDAGGTISTAAGNGGDCAASTGFACGDGGSATSALLSLPVDVEPTGDGGFLVSDLQVNVVRRVAPDGTISRVAGNYGSEAFGGDGGPATSALLSDPIGLSRAPDGGFLVADSANHRIRKFFVGGNIGTVAGNGGICSGGACGDGGAATAAQLNLPHGVVSRPDGSFYIGDSGDNRVRRVAGGTITNAAGNPDGTAGSSGDGGPATSAQLADPRGLDQCGNTVLVADFGNNRARWFGVPPVGGTTPCAPGPPPNTPTTTTTTTTPPPVAPPATSSSTATTPAPVTPTNAIPPLVLAPPVLGASIDATPIAGTVLVRLAGQRDFVPLAAATNLPLGTEFDTTKGTVSIEFATGVGDPHSTEVSKGLFITRQAQATGSPLQLDLSGQLRGCPRPGRPSASAGPTAVAARTSTRQVSVRAKGPVKSKGRYGAATVRGTAWIMKETCNTTRPFRSGTLVVVTEGIVAVSDQVKHKTVVVKAGKRYFIRARRSRR